MHYSDETISQFFEKGYSTEDFLIWSIFNQQDNDVEILVSHYKEKQSGWDTQ